MRFPPLTPVVRTLLLIFLASFVAQLVSDVWLSGRLYELLALSVYPGQPRLANLWQVVTYPFAQIPGPQGVSSFLFSGFFFYWIVASFEERHGRRWTLRVLGMSLVGASLPALAVGFVVGGRLSGFSFLTFGVLAAGVWMARILRQRIALFGQWEMTPTQLLLLFVALPVLEFLATKNALLLVADLGALGAGILFVELLSRPKDDGGSSRPRKPSGARKNPHGLRAIKGGKDEDPPGWLN
ncbi:MAG: rhomboid family intramembrane serine protease [Polyangiales bacterium]